MKRQYFGTDGIRGTVGQAPMTPDFILRLGQAAGVVIARYASNAPLGLERKRPCVLIGKDTRVSGYLLESCLEAGLTSMGVDVVLVGPMPTAAIAYLTKTLSMAAGIVISASHNPYPDNGIKFFSAQGTKLPDAWELAIEEALEQTLPCKPSEQLGKAKRLNDAAGRYIEFCKSTFVRDQQAGLSNLSGLKIVVDCAHGAAYHIAPAVFRELGAEVVSIANEPNGLNINEGVGATHPEPLANMVRAYGADYGFALDGDADRVVCVDAAGRVYNGDELLYVLVQERLARSVPVPGVVGTLMSNMALELALKRLGIAFERAKVGDRYVYERLQQQGWQLGGEASGHLLMLDVHSTGDGIVSALHVLRAVRALGQPLAAILQDMPLMPQVLKNAHLPQGYEWQNDAHLQSACAAVAQQLQGQGRLLVRPSGTEPLLRVMAEAPSAEQAQAAVDAVLAALPQANVA